jgi:geranyl-CoA carboxylase beta subunit
MLELVNQVEALERRAQMASEAKRARFIKRRQIPPRDRICRLLDPGSPFLQLGNMTGYLQDSSDPEKSLPGASLLTGVGLVSNTRCVVVASDSGINAGAMTMLSGRKMLRAFDIAQENKLPFIHLVESAGANLLKYRVEMFVAGGEIFARHARLSASGIPTITVLHGSATAGGAYMPGMSDLVIAVKGRGQAFLAGPPLLKAATGEIASAAELGGAEMHGSISGLVEYLAEDDGDALRIAREVVQRLHWGRGWLPNPRPFVEPKYDPSELPGIVPVDYRQAYDVRELVARIVDGSDFLDFKPKYGASTVCLEADIHGHSVGILGNNGPIDPKGATKATHFIQHCCQVGTSLLFLQNTTGYLVGREYEQGGMIKHGAKMIQAVTNATVPKITLNVGASFGAGNYGMCGQGYNPRFLFSWPNSRMGVMGAEQAAMTMRVVAELRAERMGQAVDHEQLEATAAKLVALYIAQESALVTSGLGLDDGVIDPRDTRRALGFILATIAEAKACVPQALTFGVARP